MNMAQFHALMCKKAYLTPSAVPEGTPEGAPPGSMMMMPPGNAAPQQPSPEQAPQEQVPPEQMAPEQVPPEQMQQGQQQAAGTPFDYWMNPQAANYGMAVMEVFGPPHDASRTSATWEGIAGMKRVTIMDEALPHNEPTPHNDYVYGVIDAKLSPTQIGELGKVSPTIIADPIKGEVTARCATLMDVAIILGFVQDYISGYAPGRREELAQRVMQLALPAWYQDEMGEEQQQQQAAPPQEGAAPQEGVPAPEMAQQQAAPAPQPAPQPQQPPQPESYSQPPPM